MTNKDDGFLYKELTYKIIGIAMEIHRELQSGFLEAVYEEVMSKELEKAKIPFEKQVRIDIYYKGEKLDKQYQADFILGLLECSELSAQYSWQYFWRSRFARRHQTATLLLIKMCWWN
ncbi:MAG: GxxExxY protein [Planctomycetota bacterium]